MSQKVIQRILEENFKLIYKYIINSIIESRMIFAIIFNAGASLARQSVELSVRQGVKATLAYPAQ